MLGFCCLGNGILLLPWDDDLDLAIAHEERLKLVHGLAPATVDHFWCTFQQMRHHHCKVWTLDEEEKVFIIWKDWGCPWKVFTHAQVTDDSVDIPFVKLVYIMIDVYEYTTTDQTIHMNKKQLKHGHVQSFRASLEHIYPLRKITLPFSGESSRRVSLGDSVTVQVPQDPETVLLDTYGEDCIKICKTSFTHHKEQTYIKSQFPCTMLPIEYFRPGHVRYHEQSVKKACECDEF